jgi:hypothetical protein
MEQDNRVRRDAIALAILGVVATLLIGLGIHYAKPISLRGAVMKEDADSRQQSPIADVQVSVADDNAILPAKTDSSGYFKLTLPRGVRSGHPVTLQFRHPDYQPVDLHETVGSNIYLAHMVPIHPKPVVPLNRPVAVVGNLFVRYSIESTTSANVGTGIKTFQVINAANVPCNQKPPCSPDGKWKAATGSASLDAGSGNEYEDARVSCIAGPCPFTKIVSDNFSRGGRAISVSVLGWADTTTFLLQGEIFREEVNDIVRESYPVLFGDSLNFTLPASAEGPTLEAEINGNNIIFPLGPSPELSWARCSVRLGKDQSKVYRCELKPGYLFQ